MKSKVTAGIFGIFLGAWGAHHFYMENTKKGLLYLLISLLSLGVFSPIIALIGLIEGIIILSMSDEDFNAKLNENSNQPRQLNAKNTNDTMDDTTNKYEVIKNFNELYESGAITKEEFESVKAKLLR